MSLESARAFIERIKTNEDFRNKVNEYKDLEARMAFAQQSGYDCTKDDMDLLKAELLEGDLEGVAGGAPFYNPFPDDLLW